MHNIKAHYNKRNALAELGRHEEAIEAFDEAIRLNPEYAKAYYGKGQELRERYPDIRKQRKYSRKLKG